MKSSAVFVSLVLFLGAASARAQHSSSNFSQGFQTIDGSAFVDRFRLRGEYFVVDATGRRFLSPTSESRQWSVDPKTSQIELFWTVHARGFKSSALHAVWKINTDRSIDVLTQQCDEITGEKTARCKKVLREEKVLLENFAPLTWVTDASAEAHLVARFTPSLEESRERLTTSRAVIGGDRGSFEVFDDQGNHWAENMRFGGVLNGLKTWRGSLVFSLYPFTNAKELGWAQGNRLDLDLTDKLRLTIRNDRDIIPGEARVKVYGHYLPKLKMKDVRTHQSFGVEEEKDLDPEFR